jgi:hypothetical protein
MSEIASRVENRRSNCSLPVDSRLGFASSPQSGLAWFWFLLPSRPGEFRPEPLTDPCLTVSGHTARATRGRPAPSAETIGFLLLPVDPCRSRLGDPPPSLHENYPVSSLLRSSPPLFGAELRAIAAARTSRITRSSDRADLGYRARRRHHRVFENTKISHYD